MAADEPTREEQIAAAVQQHYDALGDLVNDDALNLVLVVAMLNVRLEQDGLLTKELADDPFLWGEVQKWSLTRGGLRVALLMAVSLWSALEAFVEDVWIEMCPLADITDDHPLGKEKLSLAEATQLPERERYRRIWDRLRPEQGMGIGRYDDLLTHVGLRATVSDVPAPAQTMSKQGEATDDAWTRRMLGELKEVRNVVLHRRGVADSRLERVSNGAFRTGHPVEPSMDQVIDYGTAVHAYAAALQYSALHRLAQRSRRAASRDSEISETDD